VGTFEDNDFDAFELQFKSSSGEYGLALGDHPRSIHWNKIPHMAAISAQPTWKLTLDLVTTSNQWRGSFTAYRMYSPRDLQLDVNLLTSEFPATLADALDRALTAPTVLVPVAQSDTNYLAANL
jgi:hypothetical protein